MKKIFVVLSIIALIFAACEEEKSQTVTQLTVKNESRTKISNVEWNGSVFGELYSGGISYYKYDINVGGKMISTVQPGTGYVYFRKVTSNPGETLKEIKARTQDIIFVESGEQIVFTFTDNTVVVNLATNNTGTLGDLN